MKRFISLIALLICSLGLMAGEITGKGIKLGLNLSDYWGDDLLIEENHFRKGFLGGVFATYQLNETISIQPELLFSMKGSYFKGSHKEEIGYLQLTGLGKRFFPLSPNSRLALLAGPMAAFRLYSSIRVDGGDLTHDYSISTTSETSAWDFGLVAGLGWEMDIHGRTILWEARYDVGFVEVIEKEGGSWWLWPPDAKNQILSLVMGYAF